MSRILSILFVVLLCLACPRAGADPIVEPPPGTPIPAKDIIDAQALRAGGLDRNLEDGLFSPAMKASQKLARPFEKLAVTDSFVDSLEAQEREARPDAARARATQLTSTNDNVRVILQKLRNRAGLPVDDAPSVSGSTAGFWSVRGNVVDEGPAFLGTLNDEPLVLGARGQGALRVLPTPFGPNLVAGSSSNAVDETTIGAVIGGGGDLFFPNLVRSDYGVVAGGLGNQAGGAFALLEAPFATVGGGRNNTAERRHATVSGGVGNFAGGTSSAVAGGQFNRATGEYTAIGGGLNNLALGRYASVAGGYTNAAVARGSFIGGGELNAATGPLAAILGGTHNAAAGERSVIPGGTLNVTRGRDSLAAGHGAHALHDGSFVWADRGAAGVFGSTSTNQFLIRAQGNVGIDDNAPVAKLTVGGGVAPSAGDTFDLGRSDRRWRALHLAGALEAGDGLVVRTAGAEALRVDAEGNLVVRGRVRAAGFADGGGDLAGRPPAVVTNAAPPAVAARIRADQVEGTALTASVVFAGAVTGTVDRLRLAPGVVTAANLAPGAITGDTILDGSVRLADTTKADWDAAYLARAGGELAGTLRLPRNGLIAGDNQLVLSNSRVGIGTAVPESPLTVSGVIQSTIGGFKFPDGTVQTTAATGGPAGPGAPLSSDFAGNLRVRGTLNLGETGVVFADGTRQETAAGPALQQAETRLQKRLDEALLTQQAASTHVQDALKRVDRLETQVMAQMLADARKQSGELDALRAAVAEAAKADWTGVARTQKEQGEALALVRTQVEFLRRAGTPAATNRVDVAEELQNLKRQILALAADPARTAPATLSPADSARLAAIEKALTGLETRLAAQTGTNAVAAVAAREAGTRAAALETRLTGMETRLASEASTNAVTVASLRAAQDRLAQEIGKAREERAAEAARLEALGTVPADLAALRAAVTSAVARANAPSALTGQVAAVLGKLDDVETRVEAERKARAELALAVERNLAAVPTAAAVSNELARAGMRLETRLAAVEEAGRGAAGSLANLVAPLQREQGAAAARLTQLEEWRAESARRLGLLDEVRAALAALETKVAARPAAATNAVPAQTGPAAQIAEWRRELEAARADAEARDRAVAGLVRDTALLQRSAEETVKGVRAIEEREKAREQEIARLTAALEAERTRLQGVRGELLAGLTSQSNGLVRLEALWKETAAARQGLDAEFRALKESATLQAAQFASVQADLRALSATNAVAGGSARVAAETLQGIDRKLAALEANWTAWRAEAESRDADLGRQLGLRPERKELDALAKPADLERVAQAAEAGLAAVRETLQRQAEALRKLESKPDPMPAPAPTPLPAAVTELPERVARVQAALDALAPLAGKVDEARRAAEAALAAARQDLEARDARVEARLDALARSVEEWRKAPDLGPALEALTRRMQSVEQVQRVLAERKPGADEAALAARFLARGEGAWEWGGNAGTRAGRDFVGTTDNTPLELRAANQTALRLLPGVDSPTLAGGFAGNRAAGVNGAVIAGGGGPGQPQVAAGNYAFLGAGLGNTAGLMSAVAGGAGNEAAAATGFIGGGFSNRTTEAFAVIGGGAQNTAADRFTVIGGGTANRAAGASAVIAGGRENQTTAEYAAIPGGRDNLVRGAYGLAAGRRAKAVHAGSFVWADAEDADAVSERDGHFLVRAAGGVTFRTGGAALAGVELAPGGNAWSVLSTRAAKENFRAVDPERVLEQVSKLPLGTWNLRTQDPSVRHLGPVAEDFHDAFGLGESAERIQTGDADGVALAAIQGLHRQNARQAEEIEQLRRELRELREALRK